MKSEHRWPMESFAYGRDKRVETKYIITKSFEAKFVFPFL